MEKEQKTYRKLMDYALWSLTRRAHTVHELRQKLRKRENHCLEDEENVVKRLIDLNLLNDKDFILNSFQQALRLKKNGPKKVIYKLKTKGIPLEDSQQIWRGMGAKNLEKEAASEALDKWIQRFLLNTPLDQRQKAWQKCTRNLIGRGFSPDLIFELVRERKSKYNDYSQDQIE
jgi:SOS response regulatory protein OraA/RecX